MSRAMKATRTESGQHSRHVLTTAQAARMLSLSVETIEDLAGGGCSKVESKESTMSFREAVGDEESRSP
jgi:hypothetical protein